MFYNVNVACYQCAILQLTFINTLKGKKLNSSLVCYNLDIFKIKIIQLFILYPRETPHQKISPISMGDTSSYDINQFTKCVTIQAYSQFEVGSLDSWSAK